MLSFNREWDTSTSASNARLALRMRVSMSAIGSVIRLPTGLCHSGNQPRQRRLPKYQSRASEFPQVAMTPAGDLAPVRQTHRARTARQLGQAGIIAFGL